MARPIKTGVDYFPLDVDIDQDDKIEMIEAVYGIEGFGIVIKLLMKIFKEGYYYKWAECEQLLFSKRNNIDIKRVNAIVFDCLKWNIFNKELFDEYQILTSKGIQVRYLEIAKRRASIELISEFILVNVMLLNEYNNLIIDSINKVNADINEVDSNIGTQRKSNKNKENIYSDSFTEILKSYPGKKIKSVRDKRLPKILNEYGEAQIIRCIERYVSEVKNKDKQFILNESTFWNGRFEDYLDENFQDEKANNPKSEYKPKFRIVEI